MHLLDESITRLKDMLSTTGFYSTEELRKVQTYEQFEKLQKNWLNKMCETQKVQN